MLPPRLISLTARMTLYIVVVLFFLVITSRNPPSILSEIIPDTEEKHLTFYEKLQQEKRRDEINSGLLPDSPPSRNERVLKSRVYAHNKQTNINPVHTNMIKNVFDTILPIMAESEPSIGYHLKSEGSDRIPNKFRLSSKYLPRSYGKNGVLNIAYHDHDRTKPILSKDTLDECLYLPNEMFFSLKKSHKYFTSKMPYSYEQNTYSGEGIMFIGGGKFSWLSLLSIENLRSAGSKLPIEVMIPRREEYEPQLCEVILPTLNARCVLLYEYIEIDDDSSFKLSGYQYKSLSLLVSSFEKVLFLDSDNVPVSNPDILFKMDPFTSHGMVLWPDFWKRVTHPLYYDLADFKITDKRVRNSFDKVTPPEFYTAANANVNKDIPLHDRLGSIPDLSTESGQIMINKKTHFKSLLLSLYYNVYGPRHYYPLFSQGGKGEGDKETFIAAAYFFGLPVYQVNHPVGVIGHWEERYHGVGMIQYDPITDKQIEDKYRLQVSTENFHYNEDSFLDFFMNEEAKPMFIHSNYPKLDPIGLFTEEKLLNKNKEQWRLYSDQPNVGFDFELRQWELMNKYFCNPKVPLKLNYITDSKILIDSLCSNINSRLNFLISNPI